MLTIEGEVATPRTFAEGDLRGLPDQIADVSSIVPKRAGTAVWLKSVLAAAGAKPSAKFVTLASGDGKFAICVPLSALLDRAVLLYQQDGKPLAADKGGPIRVLLTGEVPCEAPGQPIDACAMVKGLARVRLTAEREPDIGHSH